MYICECGKQFEKSQSFNGHKSHCKLYIESRGLSYEDYIKQYVKRYDKVSKTLKENSILNHQIDLTTWISEQHTCEHCGKVMTEKYGSGRFCCRACANSKRHSEETRIKISNSNKHSDKVLKFNQNKHEEAISAYLQHPKKCIICDNTLSYDNRNNKTCCKNCKNKFLSIRTSMAVKSHGGNLNPRPNRNCKSGTYKGIHF